LPRRSAAAGSPSTRPLPGPVDTPLFTEGKSLELIDRIASSAPFGRLGEPEDIARLVSFLAGPDGGWVSGQVLRTNGGVI